MTKSPCCPNKISFKKVKTPNQTMGVMSTPKAGGTAPRVNFKSGSVGQTTKLKGGLFTSVVGYHDMTTRQSFWFGLVWLDLFWFHLI